MERHDFTTTPECPWCGERECERHCATCGEERFYRDGSHQGVVNIADYGAAGDGTTDDTAAIQAAVDATVAS